MRVTQLLNLKFNPIVRKTLKSVYRAELKRMSQTRQSKWIKPNNGEIQTPKLKIFNSLTRQKDEFVCEKDNRILWYSCGPTVYDTSHMGHARCYISFDILRRVLKDYFGYTVVHCMNITDVDDKIIKRSRQSFLYEQYVSEKPTADKIIKDCADAIQPVKLKFEEEQDQAKKAMYNRAITAVEEAISSGNHELLLTVSRDSLGDYLDTKNAGADYDNSAFEELPRRFEQEYHDDMQALNVEAPDILTRVSEYVPEIVVFVEQIIANGFAYESNGSVYFDTAKYAEDKNHFYAKLVPEAYGDKSALEDGEGELSLDNTSEKKSQNDFALWKKSKASEPSWTSPWGMGRPGWHIECSVMASAIFGERIDVHSGGVDLKFPHHDNEIAQSEAHYQSEQWEFLLTVKDIMRRSVNYNKYTERELALNENFLNCQKSVHEALCDSIDTRTALENVREIISQTNIYIQNNRNSSKPSNKELLKSIATYITDLLKVFGALRTTDMLDLNDNQEGGNINKEQLVMPYLEAFAKFRDDIRSIARQEKNIEILKICDDIRDVVLPEIGVRLEDHEGQSAVIKLVDREILLKEIQEKKKQEEDKRLLKIKKKAEKEAELAEKEKLKKLKPSEMFISQTDKYSKFDDKGLPTHDSEGKELTKSALKKLNKLYDAQEKRFNSSQ